MSTSLRYPPTLSSLLEDERYRKLFLTVPRLAVKTPTPWLIMAESTEGKWAKTLRDDYRDAVRVANKIRKRDDYRDVALICRPRVLPAPTAFPWTSLPNSDDPFLEWCGRCRRPTLFRKTAKKHPALFASKVIVEGQSRCYFCGISEETNRTWSK